MPVDGPGPEDGVGASLCFALLEEFEEVKGDDRLKDGELSMMCYFAKVSMWVVEKIFYA